MPPSMALAKGARITGGAFCLLFFLYTGFWLVSDLAQFGLPYVWDSWTGAARPGLNQVSNGTQFGLALAQLAAAVTAFMGKRSAGGLLAVATTGTFATALQTMIATGDHTSDDRWYLHADSNDDLFLAVFLGSMALVLLSFAAGIVLLAGIRSWPRQKPSIPPARPVKAAGMVGGLVLGAMAVAYVAWHLLMLVEGGPTTFTVFYLGAGVLPTLTSLSPGWFAVVFLILSAVAALNSLMRGSAARGLAFGLALVLLPNALMTAIQMISSGTLGMVSESMPALSILGYVQLALDLLGSVALLALMGRGEPVAPGWQPPAAAPQFGVPGFVPPGAPQGPAPAGFPPPGPQGPNAAGFPPPGGPVPPQSGPPMPPAPPAGAPPMPPAPPAGAPPMPPGNPPSPQGGFGPPQY